MKATLLISFMCVFLSLGLAQKDARLAQGLTPLSSVPVARMPRQDNAQLQAAEAARRGPGVAWNYATNISVDLDPSNSGQWETTPAGDVWRLRIKSPGAFSINLGFSKYDMPAGGKLILYKPDYSQVIGPFTPADNEEHEQLWTPLLPGDEMVIEVQLPARGPGALALKLAFVNHAFEDFNAVISGSCNLDVICGAADGWGIVDNYRDIIQSVAVISTGGGTFCTGFLVNNVEEDCTPFFMTANHCGINAGNAPSLVTYWNYQNSTCRQPNTGASGGAGDGQLNDFNTGAIFRASRSNSDFVLVELDDPVSPTANAYFAGWDASGAAISSAVGIHHPRTDEKRISFENDPTQFTTYSSSTPTTNYTHVRVVDWDTGTTEGGSSGSPLFDQNSRVVGQLHGGGAACGNNLSDWYGSFAISWDAGGSASSRLRDWLDPNDTGTEVINGRWASGCGFSISANPVVRQVCKPQPASYTIEVGGGFPGNVALSLSNTPPGATFTFSPAQIAPGGTSTLTVQTTNVNPGTYNFTVTGSNGGNSGQIGLTLTVLAGTSTAPTLLSPANNSTNVFPNPALSWNGDGSGATTYTVQIATNSNFTPLLETGTTTATTYQPTNANLGLTRYFWRVRASNTCGTSSFSGAFNFTTSNVNCETYSSNFSTTISEVGTPSISNDISIGDDYTIADVTIQLEVTHTYVGDLDARLFPPGGGSVLLFDRPGQPASDFGCGEDNLNVSFNANSPNSAAALENTCNPSSTGTGNSGPPYAIAGSYRPLGNLAGLLGNSSNGLWTLEINDNEAADGGILESWSVTVCYQVLAAPPVIVTNNVLQVPRGDQRPITNAFLRATDDNSTPSQLVYTIRSLPTEGNIRRNGQVLSLGGTFTQAEINSGTINYLHSGGIILNDDFDFDLTNAAGASVTGNTFFIEITVGPMVASLNQTAFITCNGDQDAAISVTVSGGLPPYQYALNAGNFGASNTFSNLAAGNYTVTVRDAFNEEVTTATLTITQPTPVSGTVAVNGNQITVTPQGGSPGYTYRLNGGNPQTSNVFGGLANGSYTVTISDSNGCTGTVTATVSVNSLVVSATLISNITCRDANNGSIAATASGGTAPYQYRLNGTGTYQSSATFTGLAAGSYTIEIRDQAGFTRTTNSVSITNPAQLAATAAVNMSTITVNATGGTPPLRYRLNAGNTQTSNVFAGLANGTYTLTVLDANDCTVAVTATVAVNSLVVSATLISNITCRDANDGSIAATASGGTAPYQYRLNGTGAYQSSATFTGLAAGSYTIEIRDQAGFTRTTNSVTITNPAQLAATAAVNMNTITVNATGGTPPLRYRLNTGNTQTSNVFAGLANGTYTLTVLDANDCTVAVTATVAVNTMVANAARINNITCHNANDGSITATVSGGTAPFEYRLNAMGTYQSSPTFTGLAAGSYTIQIRDQQGFTRTTNIVVITNPAQLVATAAVNLNTITVTATGGTPPLRYQLNAAPPQTSNVFTGLANGTYTLTVLDANDCLVTFTATVATNTLIVSATLVNNITCHNANNGEIQAVVSGGTPPYQYSLDGLSFQDEATFTGLAAGTYLVTVRDAAGFLRSTNVLLITNPPVLTSVVTVEGAAITVMATGGTGTLAYSINGINFQSNPVFTDLVDGVYQVSVRDANGCAVVTTVIVAVNNLLANAAIIAPISCFDAADGSIQVMVTGGIAPFRFSLNGGSFQTDSLFAGLGPGNYSIIVEDAMGTSFNANTIILTEPGMLELDLVVQQDSITATASGGSSPYTYSLDGVAYQTSPAFYDLANGDYEVWVRDAEGCTVSQQISILVGLLAVPEPDLQFTLYPNPTTGQFQVMLRQATGNSVQCDIYNATGQLVQRQLFAQAQANWQAEFDLSAYPAGMYEVVVTNGQQWGVKRIIVE